MQYCINHPEEMSKLSKLKAQITDIKEIMMDNIEKVPIDFCFQSFFFFFDEINAWVKYIERNYPWWASSICYENIRACLAT